MKILVFIPCLYGAEHTNEAIDSVCHNPELVDVLLLDNGAEASVKNILWKYSQLHNVHLIKNEKNVYVTAGWQQGLDFFLKNEQYTNLIIMNSDLIMHKSWYDIVRNRLTADVNESIIPNIIDDKYFKSVPVDVNDNSFTKVDSGTPGVFIMMNREQAKIINPLPLEVMVWFSDNWIYDIIRNTGYKTVIPKNLYCYHYWSQNVQKVNGISDIIEQDKKTWNNVTRPRLEKYIEELKNKKD